MWRDRHHQFQHHNFVVPQPFFNTVKESNPVRVFQIARRAHDHSDRTARMQRSSAGRDHIPQSNHLSSLGIDQVRILVNSFCHCRSVFQVLVPNASFNNLGRTVPAAPCSQFRPLESGSIVITVAPAAVACSGNIAAG